MTHFRSLSIVLFTLSMSGCWPYLADDYESYLEGSGTDSTDVASGELYLVGDVTWTEQRGEYWGEGSTDGEVVSAQAILYLIDGGPRSALARWAGGDGNCQDASVLSGNYEDGIALSEPPDIVLSGRETVRVPWIDESRFWGVSLGEDLSLGHASTYDMNEVETDIGVIGGTELVQTPRRAIITNPDMTGASPPSVGTSGMRITWNNGGDVVLLSFTTVNGAGDVMENVNCGTTGDSFSLTLDDLSSFADAAYTVVQVGNVSNGSGTVGDDIINDVAAIHWQVGAVVP